MSQATDMLAAYIAAEMAVLAGQSFQFGQRQLTLADLSDIREGRAEWQQRVNAEAATTAGRASFALADFRSCR